MRPPDVRRPPASAPSPAEASGDGTPAPATVRAARRRRLDRVRQRMEECGVDVVMLSHGADLPWLIGYRAMPLERLTLLVVRGHGECVLIVPELEAPRVPCDDELFALRPWADTEDPISLACDLVGPHVRGTLALSDRAWAATAFAMQRRLPSARWVTASTVISPLRAVKDPDEIGVLRAAAAAADRVAHALQTGAVPVVGRTEAAVSAEIADRLIREGHRKVNFAIVGSGPNGASPHHDPGLRRIAPGDVVVCDFGGEFPADESVGYCSDITRTLSVSQPGGEVRECYAVLLAAQQAAVGSVRPGVPAERIDEVARSVITEAGYGDSFIHRTGHGIGIEEHEDPYIVSGNHTALEAGHAFSIEPGIYLRGRFGMRLEDIVVVTEGGVEQLNHADHALAVLEP